MSSSRIAILILAIVGTAANTWFARPASWDEIDGWLFALIWVSGPWLWLSVCIARDESMPVATGALVALVASELFFRALSNDALLLLAVKPGYQILIGGIGAWAGHLIARRYGKND